ncbi:hypothetical protein KVT40_005579 [Elsinoe batatas]|uniref:Uncharacterized protein n=1 Tax=Elsinoe batatas TaxID=2601811 RepID=A0A8K0L1E9_9PEZI|nr:hypothetical protein KVT40_005579 [Elsinoe batatas]
MAKSKKAMKTKKMSRSEAPKPFQFFDLPLEVRCIVYHHVSMLSNKNTICLFEYEIGNTWHEQDSASIRFDYGPLESDQLMVKKDLGNLARSCRAAYNESVVTLYQSLHLYITLLGQTRKVPSPWRRLPSTKLFKHIKSVSLDINVSPDTLESFPRILEMFDWGAGLTNLTITWTVEAPYADDAGHYLCWALLEESLGCNWELALESRAIRAISRGSEEKMEVAWEKVKIKGKLVTQANKHGHNYSEGYEDGGFLDYIRDAEERRVEKLNLAESDTSKVTCIQTTAIDTWR